MKAGKNVPGKPSKPQLPIIAPSARREHERCVNALELITQEAETGFMFAYDMLRRQTYQLEFLAEPMKDLHKIARLFTHPRYVDKAKTCNVPKDDFPVDSLPEAASDMAWRYYTQACEGIGYLLEKAAHGEVFALVRIRRFAILAIEYASKPPCDDELLEFSKLPSCAFGLEEDI